MINLAIKQHEIRKTRCIERVSIALLKNSCYSGSTQVTDIVEIVGLSQKVYNALFQRPSDVFNVPLALWQRLMLANNW